jgi:hypothetical protein
MGERCERCDRPLWDDGGDWSNGQPAGTCEGHEMCAGPSVDWRQRALDAERERDEARTCRCDARCSLCRTRDAAIVAERDRALTAARELREAVLAYRRAFRHGPNAVDSADIHYGVACVEAERMSDRALTSSAWLTDGGDGNG